MSDEEDRSRKLLLAGRMEEEEVGGGREVCMKDGLGCRDRESGGMGLMIERAMKG